MQWIFFRYFFRRVAPPVFLLLFLLTVGTVGYHIIERWSILDSAFMSIITITTVGFGEVHPLTSAGKIFTIVFLLSGVVFYAMAINGIVRIIIDYRFKETMGQIRMNRRIENMKDHYVICGGGRMAYAIAGELDHAGVEFIFVEKNPESIVSEHVGKWPIIQKDALLEDTLIEARIQYARGLAVVLPTDADNLFVVLSARKLNPGLFIQTRIALESSRSKMIQAGADRVVSPYNAGGVQIARSFINPEVEDFLSIVVDRSSYDFEMKIITVNEEDPFCNQTLRETDFRKRGLTVIGIRFPDGRTKFAPDAGTMLSSGYQIFLIGPGDE